MRLYPRLPRLPRRRSVRRPLRLVLILAVLVIAALQWLEGNPRQSAILQPSSPAPVAQVEAAAPQSCRTSLPLALPGPADVTGPARVIDGDTLAIGQQRVRLNGIQAAEMDTAEGPQAKAALEQIIAGQSVACARVDADSYNRMVGRCVIGSTTDLGLAMLAAGAAKTWPRYLAKQPHRQVYLATEVGAQRAGCGIWRN